MKKTKVKQEDLFKRWYRLCEPNKWMWFWQTFLYVVYAAIFALMTIIAAKTINCLYNGDWQGAFTWLAVELANIIIRNIVLHIQYIFYAKHYGFIRKNITTKIFNKLLKCDEKSIKKFSTEKIINIAQSNMGYASEFPDYLANILRYTVQVGIALVAIFTSNLYAGLVVVALSVVNFFVYNHLNKRLGRIMNNRYEKKDNSFKEYSNILSGKMVIEELDAKEEYKTKLLTHIEDFNKEYVKYYKTQSFRDQIYYAIWNVVIYGITAFLIYLISQGSLELSIYLVIVPYLTSCVEKLNSLYTKFEGFENVRVDIDRLNMILSLSDKQMIQYGNVNEVSTGYNLGFINVSCKVPDTGVKLKNIDISFKMHGLNIIKGERNSGKRCVFDMLRRRIAPDEGKILLDNLNLYDYSEKTFKNHIDYCASHPVFVNGTVKENLLLATKDFEFIKALVRELGLEEKINSFPKGYNTAINDIISGEDRFWIGLIRAALSKCKVLMIYEYPEDVSPDFHIVLRHIIATSESEKRTLIFFTHKDDYDSLADKLYVIENGKVHLSKLSSQKKSKN